ncbi:MULTISPECIES: hypothetical protein [unclassified Mesorhizobium]|uniref:hypothetical protein n=1 Tax=unclassified Mesorhizobium TaxID=325217 RepID=UPI000FD8E3F9|nr:MULTISPECIES: hypothetical protein [unclassified Mesorhizobium]TGR38713.1 hypothetical protein EN842_44940 [bacterium M00.F.Ca.ET.199.01.1.1]TGU28176.1 hypothetical protein EN799_38815 [bacterium M00.F.Ca.ET.156.01.1.1]TGV83739.1 hypothetical protein EN792_025270 [Mesorhizobium sp. M00.F.Ca.ET.149.01.1.1]RWC87637.1 MAG: hypothetical protein EOS72_20545 [Mesorhizobium sp.]TGR21641.1 hypothetical protein EN845_23685 [Mesorhizobium sp. M8A.F.Ca.ET.202.01.1.1]
MGTRFRLFVQPPFEDPTSSPEIIAVSSPRGSVGPGPSDDRMYVVEPVGKTRPYGVNHGPLGTPVISLPPWTRAILDPAVPDEEGNFDHYQPSTPGFEAAHAFGCARFTLDVWERYIGQPITWHFHDHYDRLEISILPGWDNAQYGYGFLELGSQFVKDGRTLPFSLDFDIIAHEVGHAFVYSVLGIPDPGAEFPEYLGFQEAFSDCVSLIAAMHFPSVIDNVLTVTHGNLYIANQLSRFSEFSPHRQIREANNKRTMADFANGWTDEHALSQPLTGAVFDILVDVFHESLVARGLISPEAENLADLAEIDPAAELPLQEVFDRDFARNPEGFVEALLDARDIVGTYLAETLWALAPDFLDYGDVARTMLAVDDSMTGGELSRIIFRDFDRRGIFRCRAGPRLTKPNRKSHVHEGRIARPLDQARLPDMSYFEKYWMSRSGADL